MKTKRNSPHTPPDRKMILTAPVDLEGAQGEGEATRPRRFTMTAYTGVPMQLSGWRFPVVVDLTGMEVGKQRRPILLNHDHDVDSVLGQTDSLVVMNHQLLVAGQIMGDSARARQVIGLNDKGFAWQASIGARADLVEFVPEGKITQVNGREFPGPVNVARRAALGEISFVVLGADDNTSAQIAAKATEPKEEAMDFDRWVQAQGFELERLTEQQHTSLWAMYDAQQAKPATPPQPPAISDPVGDIRAKAAAEAQRIAAIRKLYDGEFPDLEARAIAEGWDVTRAELEKLRASRPAAPAIVTNGSQPSPTSVLTAAVCVAAKLDSLEKQFNEPTLEAAHKRFQGRVGLQELLLEAAWANGYTGRIMRDHREVLRFAFGHDIEAGFSTIDIGGILSNVANKFLLEGFYSVERTWRNITAIRNVSDFKTVTSYRLIGKDQYEQIAPGGEIKHGTLGQEAFTNRADTYGLMLTIDRRDIINDDLGAITLVPRKLGRGAGLKINDVFWTVFLNNAAFFTAANKNFIAGAATALGIDSLTEAERTFMEQVDADGKPIGMMPAILLVPPSLNAIGSQLFKSMELRENTANAKYPITNPHQGKYRVEVSRYLANSQYPGNSQKAWYLLADANDLPVIETAFLNGQEAPTIESADADFNVMGVQMRGYHDFGCALQDPKGGVKAKGEA